MEASYFTLYSFIEKVSSEFASFPGSTASDKKLGQEAWERG